MRILFWGTPAYALPTLQALAEAGHTLVGVVSQPDRRRGRGRALQASPVKAAAAELSVPAFTPERISREEATQRQLAELEAEVFVVVAFGQLLPTSVLEMPPLGCWNGHASLLPRWRGAAPIQWSLLSGDPETGVGVMAMDSGIDTGPVLLERRRSIGLLENASQLRESLSHLTAELMVEAMPLIEAAGPGSQDEQRKRLGVRHQNDAMACKARLLGKEDRRIDWGEPALQVHRRVMALHPGAWARLAGRRLKVLATEPLLAKRAAELSSAAAALARDPLASRAGMAPGTLVDVVPGIGLVISTGAGNLLLREGQLEGRRAVAGGAFVEQLRPAIGERLGN